MLFWNGNSSHRAWVGEAYVNDVNRIFRLMDIHSGVLPGCTSGEVNSKHLWHKRQAEAQRKLASDFARDLCCLARGKDPHSALHKYGIEMPSRYDARSTLTLDREDIPCIRAKLRWKAVQRHFLRRRIAHYWRELARRDGEAPSDDSWSEY